MQSYVVENVVNLSDVANALDVDVDDLSENVEGVTWGDANYTLIDPFTFWKHFVQSKGMEVTIPWAVVEVMMIEKNIRYINLEG